MPQKQRIRNKIQHKSHLYKHSTNAPIWGFPSYVKSVYMTRLSGLKPRSLIQAEFKTV